MGISNSLPVTGYIKMVDIWMITTMTYPFSVIVLQCALEVLINNKIDKNGNFHSSIQILKDNCISGSNKMNNKGRNYVKINFFIQSF